MNEEIKKSINKGRLNKLGLIIMLISVLAIGYFIFLSGGNANKIVNAVSNESTAVAQNQIAQNEKRSDTILYQDFVTIKGKKYQIRLKDDKFEVLKDDQWVPIEDVVGEEGTVVLQNGKLLLITPDGRTIALDTGDILTQDGTLKQVDDDGNLADFNSDRLYLKDGKLKYIDDDGKEKNVDENDIVGLDGKAYKMTDGVLKDMGQTFSHYVAQKDPKTGKLKFFRKGLRGNLIPVDEADVPNGAKVEMDGRDYEYLNGNLIPKPKFYTAKKDKDGNLKYYDKDGNEVSKSKLKDGDIVTLNGKKYKWENGELKPIPKEIKSLDDLNGIDDYDYVVTDENGKPAYYQKVGDEWIPVDPSNIPNKAIIYYKGKPYIKNSKGQLVPFKPKKGQAFYKAGKAYTLGKGGNIIGLNDGDIVDTDGSYYIVDDGSIDALNNQNVLLHDKNKGIAFVDGKPYILGKGGEKKAIDNDTIIFRGSQPYKFINGKFIPLSYAEIEALKKAENRKQQEIKKTESGNNKTIKNNDNSIGINQKIQQKRNSDVWYSVYSADASVKSIQPPREEKNNTSKQDNNDDLTKELLGKLGQEQTEYQQQNGQAQKEDFLKNNKENGVVPTDDLYQKSPFTILAGDIIDATLITGVNTDQPGNVIAQISRNVYDTKTGNYLLIPQGSTLLGIYNSQVTSGAETVLVVWNKLRLPDGRQISLNGLPGLDLSGLSGIGGDVDNHWGDLTKAVAGMSLFSAGIQFGAGMTTTGGNSLNALQLIAASISQQLGQLGIQVFQRVLNRQPTISLAMGRSIKVGITHNLVFSRAFEWGKTITLVNKGSHTNKKHIQNNKKYLREA